MTHTCENKKCRHTFKIERHKIAWLGNHRVLLLGTGKSMVYKGDMNREYAMCPKCGTVEHQFSAEARDQSELKEEEIFNWC